MCCLFGFLDYAHAMRGREKSRVINALARASEMRGTDATGIAYVCRDRLRIFKKPLPAHRMRFFVPSSCTAVMGHTRMTTQGNAKYNENNHPFPGRCGNQFFALAHNGVLHNDRELRREYRLPDTRIQTDSYVAVQLLEKEKVLDFGSLKRMAEEVAGSFAFTLLDSDENLYFIKGDSPLCLYHFKKDGYYLYASTEEILKSAVKKLRLLGRPHDVLLPDCGDLLRIGRDGTMACSSFDASNCWNRWEFWPDWDCYSTPKQEGNNSYLQELKDMAGYYGYLPEDVEDMHQRGYSCGEIEEVLYGEDLLEEF